MHSIVLALDTISVTFIVRDLYQSIRSIILPLTWMESPLVHTISFDKDYPPSNVMYFVAFVVDSIGIILLLCLLGILHLIDVVADIGL